MKKSKKVCVCACCFIEPYCAANNWCLFDSNNKRCPNYKDGMKQQKELMKGDF